MIMPKKIAVINDLSSFGRCSLVASISVLAAMGIQPCPLPTAILSAQSEYPSYYFDDYTEHMEDFRSEWEKMGQHFDGIYTGYVASEAQILQIFRFLDTFKTEDNFLLVDPIMGDDGITYDMFTPELLENMKKLAARADIITPNLTEFCLLTGQDYQGISSFSNRQALLERLTDIANTYLEGIDHPVQIIITGIHVSDSCSPEQIGNLYIGNNRTFFHAVPAIGGSYSGTGDLFASCLCGGIARREDISSIIPCTVNFLSHALADSAAQNVPVNDGVNYEQYLPLLMAIDKTDQSTDTPCSNDTCNNSTDSRIRLSGV